MCKMSISQWFLEVVLKPHLRPNSPPASPERLAMAGRLRCKPLQNAHILPCMLRFFIGLRPRVGGITHLIVLINVCLLLLSLI
jgi:hypothetical protein